MERGPSLHAMHCVTHLSSLSAGGPCAQPLRAPRAPRASAGRRHQRFLIQSLGVMLVGSALALPLATLARTVPAQRTLAGTPAGPGEGELRSWLPIEVTARMMVAPSRPTVVKELTIIL